MLTKSSTTRFFIVILNFIFSLPLFEQTQEKQYVHVSHQKTWALAKRYCREHHVDLASFSNRDEFDARGSQCSFSEKCWIGLQRDQNDPNVWNWSDGEESGFTNWKYSEPDNNNGNENCVAMGSSAWFDYPCDNQYAFLCYDDLILVKENKTWEEALEHCRTLGLNLLYDLPHMHSGGDNLRARKSILHAQTPEVWIGLRFLGGEWLWVNGKPLQERLPTCPAPGMHCGTMSKTGELIPLRDCLERKNLFCFPTN